MREEKTAKLALTSSSSLLPPNPSPTVPVQFSTGHNTPLSLPLHPAMADDDAGRADQAAEVVQFRVKSPSSTSDGKELVLEVPLASATVADLHRLITDKYEGHPDESRQTVSVVFSPPRARAWRRREEEPRARGHDTHRLLSLSPHHLSHPRRLLPLFTQSKQLIYAGKVLKDREATVRDVLRQVRLQALDC
jgi:hypothetical protein